MQSWKQGTASGGRSIARTGSKRLQRIRGSVTRGRGGLGGGGGDGGRGGGGGGGGGGGEGGGGNDRGGGGPGAGRRVGRGGGRGGGGRRGESEGGGGGGGEGWGVGSHGSGRTRVHRTRGSGVGGATARARSWGDPADLDGYRRHAARLRPPRHAGRGARGPASGDRFRGRRNARAPGCGARRRRPRRAGRHPVPLSRHDDPRGARLPGEPGLPGPSVNPFYHRIYRVVRHIPKGRVATYGVVARLAGRPGAARTVGWALSALPEESDVPWWRVLNAAGRISLSGADHRSAGPRAPVLRGSGKFAPGGGVYPAAV